MQEKSRKLLRRDRFTSQKPNWQILIRLRDYHKTKIISVPGSTPAAPAFSYPLPFTAAPTHTVIK